MLVRTTNWMASLRPTKRRIGWVVAILSLVAISFSAGWFWSRQISLGEALDNTARPVRYNDPDYPMISPLVSVAIPNSKGFPELHRTESDVTRVITEAKKNGGVSEVGVYFRQPLNAHWLGINENGVFDPGSLIKVPVLMAYLKLSESNPLILKKRIYYDSKQSSDVPNPLPSSMKSGTYTVEELLRAMIVDSDNAAKDALVDNIDPEAVQDVFDEMNLNFLKDPSGTISPRQYVIIVSRIYNATYLNRYYSNYAMQLLSQSTFKGGLAAGVPANLQVAHKYGERGVYEDKALVAVELHDCGVIYEPDDPYNLCIMTKGSDVDALARTIRDVSAAIYNDRGDFKPN